MKKPKIVEVKEKKIQEKQPPSEKEWIFHEIHEGKKTGAPDKAKELLKKILKKVKPTKK